ncbi:hypothetical protein IJI55_00375, partial [Candidatus Saccharibacteria bacterium]|nr:hypothetical protein [Candidatus Saccharibacteria bacterium]
NYIAKCTTSTTVLRIRQRDWSTSRAMRTTNTDVVGERRVGDGNGDWGGIGARDGTWRICRKTLVDGNKNTGNNKAS